MRDMDDPLHRAEAGHAGHPLVDRREVGQGHRKRSDLSLLTLFGFLFLTFNTGMAIYRSGDDYGSIAFVVFSYVDLVLLFYCMRFLEPGDRSSPARDKVKVAVWLLTMLLTATFSYKVAALMPAPVAVLVWSMAAVTAAGVHYAFFIHEEKKW